MNRLKMMIVEYGLSRTIPLLQRVKDLNFIDLIYCNSSFIDSFIDLYDENVSVLLFSDFKGYTATIKLIQMFKKVFPHMRLMVVSQSKYFSIPVEEAYLREGADSVFHESQEEAFIRRLEVIQDSVSRHNAHPDEKWHPVTRKVIAHLRNRYFQQEKVICTYICNHPDYSASSIYHHFKNDTGLTVLQWMNQLRINKAKHLLESTSRPLKWIAGILGYKSTHGMISTFKKITGTTPGEYRKKTQ